MGGEDRLRIEIFGPMSISYRGQPIVLAGRKERALLGSLVLGDEWRMPRDRFLGLLWSEADPARAPRSFSNSLYEVRSALEAAGCTALQSDKQAVWLPQEAVTVDLWEAIESAKSGAPIALLQDRDRLTETLLTCCSQADRAFRDWLLAKRQSLETRITNALEDSLRAIPPGTTHARAEPIARALARLDPTHEEAARALIHARAAAGDLGSAFRIYKALWTLLETEYDTQPAQETQSLIAELRLAQPETAIVSPDELPVPIADVAAHRLVVRRGPALPAVAPAAPPRKLLLNIGTFDTTGVRDEVRYLISGFRQELSACLVRFREWTVRDLVQLATGARTPSPRDGEYVIDATAFDTGRGVRLIVMLRDAQTNEYIWSERLDLRIEEWFDAQERVVRRLAGTLRLHVSAARVENQLYRPDLPATDYDSWLKAQAFGYKFDPESIRQADAICDELMQRHPSFAPAIALAVNNLNLVHIARPGVSRDIKRNIRALDLAHAAVTVDPTYAKAQSGLAWSYIMCGRPVEANIAATIAHELNENDSWTRVGATSVLAMCGCTPQLIDRITSMHSDDHLLTPAQWAFHVTSLFLAGRYDLVPEAAQKSGTSYHMTPAWIAASYAHLGDYTAARAWFEEFVELIRTRWTSEEKQFNEMELLKWFLVAHPIFRADDWHRLATGVSLASGLEIPQELVSRAKAFRANDG